MSLLIDVRPLRESPAFRRLWIGSTLSGIGTMMTTFAVALQMWTLTRSSFAVGARLLEVVGEQLVTGQWSLVDSSTFGHTESKNPRETP